VTDPRSEVTRCRSDAAQTNPRLSGYWSIMWEGRAGYGRRWVGLDHKGDPEVIVCDHDSTDVLCPACTARLGDVLADVPALLWDLWLAETRDVRFVEHGSMTDQDGGAGAWPWNERAAKARANLQRTVVAFAQAMSFDVDTPTRYGELVTELRHAAGRIARHEDAQGWASRLSRSVAGAHRAIDRPVDRWCLGSCPDCGQDIYGERTRDPHAVVECPEADCHYRATLADHQSTKLAAGHDQWLTPTELVGAIACGTDQVVTRAQIERWFRHDGLPREPQPRHRWVDGQIVTEFVDAHRLGDVLAYAEGERTARDTMSTPEVALDFGVDEATVRQWVRRGLLKPLKSGAKPLRFRRVTIDQFRRGHRPAS
jgi:hypothetical protein